MRTNAVNIREADRTESAFVRAHVGYAVSRQREPATFATYLHVGSPDGEVLRDGGASTWPRSFINHPRHNERGLHDGPTHVREQSRSMSSDGGILESQRRVSFVPLRQPFVPTLRRYRRDSGLSGMVELRGAARSSLEIALAHPRIPTSPTLRDRRTIRLDRIWRGWDGQPGLRDKPSIPNPRYGQPISRSHVYSTVRPIVGDQ